MPKDTDDRRKIRRSSDFLLKGSFLMSLIIGLLVGYNQLQQKFQDERWITLKEQNAKIDEAIGKMDEKLDKLSGFITECKLKLESNDSKTNKNSRDIASLWKAFKQKINFWEDKKDEGEHSKGVD
jgi:peptidoglycan hydrolase CwlO-like protein